MKLPSGKHARVVNVPLYPTFIYGVCMGIPIFHIFVPKHRLWVLVRTASPTIYVLSKSKKIIKSFLLKSFDFYNL